ncbi:pleurocidin-like peptide WF3 isoform X4 [Hippoglossus stenolepis]|uniref:pleurocidin-like peptide WF3 isoform X4 n=1 Tax=Hippoglossus stenolepis TaxID=195615 RepID=UPI001FAF6B47|nr:pleurocidin-like peptide WF3 isoform X4 [Hippoglossus stenolepis]XP_047194093.1 pleurocidin-like peptide WF3 isoform X4 [Hippoglossus stenolepis]XP_047194094.1 pleurocidin-like peptide WF3 isoform X4 [Hippoglossus stenolepis]
MKFAAAFLVLFMVVLMAEPGEGFFKKWIKKAVHGGLKIGEQAIKIAAEHHGYVGQQQQELDKRAVEDDPNVIAFD